MRGQEGGKPIEAESAYTGSRFPAPWSVYGIAKRSLDLLLGALLLLLTFPIVLVAAVLIVVEDGFPVFFTHQRVAQGGGMFKMFKLRTMVRDAEAALARDPEMLAKFKVNYKLDNDPRLLRCGRFLRELSIDELPQLWNVVRGDMSLVGPRPVVSDELLRYEGHLDWYLSLKPGCAGVWQSEGRSDVDLEGRIILDRRYHDTASFWVDLRIMFMTLVAILKKRGAR